MVTLYQRGRSGISCDDFAADLCLCWPVSTSRNRHNLSHSGLSALYVHCITELIDELNKMRQLVENEIEIMKYCIILIRTKVSVSL